MSEQKKIVEKIAKLLNLASNQQGTSEGDAALSRAMEMMSRYGIDESDVHSHNAKTNSEMGVTVINFDKAPYKKQQFELIYRIARALGCYALGFRSYVGSSRSTVTSVRVYGRAIDRERVEMLFSVASMTMVDSAMKSIAPGTPNIRSHRLSHMIGYAQAIEDSLTNHEADVRDSNGHGELAIMNDIDRAERYARSTFNGNMKITNSRGSRVNMSSFSDGYASGSRFDTGNTSRIDNKRALTA